MSNEQLELQAKALMTREALSRYHTLKTVHQDLAQKLILTINQLIQKKLVHHIDDNTLKILLKQLQKDKKEFHIQRK